MARVAHTALLDADVIAYVAAAQAVDDWGDEDGTIVCADKASRQAIEDAHRWAQAAGCAHTYLCFSSRHGHNFRKDICPGYKADRKDKPEAYAAVVEALEDAFDVLRIEGMEADDVMGIMATNGEIANPVIVSIDKDLQTIPCRLFNPRKTQGKPWRISKADADRYWLTQALTGDATDGYKGCPGIGPKKAAGLLSRYVGLAEMWPAVLDAYLKAGLDTTQCLLNVRMARILRAEDYRPDTAEIRLWGPDTRRTEWRELPSPGP